MEIYFQNKGNWSEIVRKYCTKFDRREESTAFMKLSAPRNGRITQCIRPKISKLWLWFKSQNLNISRTSLCWISIASRIKTLLPLASPDELTRTWKVFSILPENNISSNAVYFHLLDTLIIIWSIWGLENPYLVLQ